MNEPEPIEDGGPAFPHHVYKFENLMSKHGIFDGMSLRDYFAGMALSNHHWQLGRQPIIKCATDCYAIADAMIKASKEDP
jgi:hypothetical protein